MVSQLSKCNTIITRAVLSRYTIFLSIEGLKSQSLSRLLEVSENGHVSAISFVFSMELFQHPNKLKESISRLPYNVQSLILRRTMAEKSQMNILMTF